MENANEESSTTTADKEFHERPILPDSRASTVKGYEHRKGLFKEGEPRIIRLDSQSIPSIHNIDEESSAKLVT